MYMEDHDLKKALQRLGNVHFPVRTFSPYHPTHFCLYVCMFLMHLFMLLENKMSKRVESICLFFQNRNSFSRHRDSR